MEKAHAGDVVDDVGSQRQIAIDNDSEISDNGLQLADGTGQSCRPLCTAAVELIRLWSPRRRQPADVEATKAV